VRGHDLATVNAAAAFGNAKGLRLALGAVASTPVLIDGFDGAGLDDGEGIVEAALGRIAPIDDVRGSSVYRKRMVEFLVAALVDVLRQRMGQD
jgi:carbon-monoxide dehydrogenase medium subunit